MAPVGKIYEDDSIFVFLSNSPINRGHALVIPKGHYEQVYHLPDEIASKLGVALKKFSIIVKKAMNADGVNIHMNNDKSAGQAVFHSHFHIIPRYNKDGYVNWEPKISGYKKGEAEEIALKIREFV